jgi:hypothetical protein
MRPARPGGRVLMDKCLVALRDVGPMTIAELAAFTDRAPSTCRWEMAAHRKAKRVHICAWQAPAFRGKWAPIYAVGDRPDAKRQPTVYATYSQRYRERLKMKQTAMLSSNPWRTP